MELQKEWKQEQVIYKPKWDTAMKESASREKSRVEAKLSVH